MTEKKDEPRESADLVQFKLRIRESLRADIEAAANGSGRSMNAEITARLEASLREDEAFGTADTKQSLIWLASQIREIEAISGKRWTEDRATFEAVSLAAADSIEHRRPEPDNVDEVYKTMDEISQMIGQHKKIEKLLLGCGVLVERPRNALLDFVNPEAAPTVTVAERDESKWLSPKDTHQPASDEDIKDLGEALAYHEKAKEDLDLANQKLEEFNQPIEEAKIEGRRIFQQFKVGYKKMVEKLLAQSNAA